MINSLQYSSQAQSGYCRKPLSAQKCSAAPAFGNKISIPNSPSKVFLEKVSNKFEFASRFFFSKIFSLFVSKDVARQREEFKKLDANSPQFLAGLYSQVPHLVGEKPIEINLENNEIQRLVGSNESCIFIMNHDNQRQDPRMVGAFYGLLAREHLLLGTPEKCPLPRVILNEDILKIAGKKTRELMEKFGCVGVDANLFSVNNVANGKKLLPVIKDFIADKVHIFIFPEGKMCGFKNMDLEYKFQTGIADIIGKVMRKKSRVKVVPLGFSYKKDVSGIHIGDPVYFKSENGQTLATRGSVGSSFASPEYKDFFGKAADSEAFQVVTKGGKPVTSDESSDYIAGILCENLKIAKEESKKSIDATPPKEIHCLD